MPLCALLITHKNIWNSCESKHWDEIMVVKAIRLVTDNISASERFEKEKEQEMERDFDPDSDSKNQ
jgi:hypothetical protein